MILFLAALAAAGEGSGLSLAETLRLVVERNPENRSAEAGVSIAAIEARRARLDRFTASVGATGGLEAGMAQTWNQPLGAANAANWSVRAEAGLPIYAGGSIRAAIDEADAEWSIAKANHAITQRSLVRAAYTAYWSIKGYELQIAAAEEGLSLTKASLAVISAKADAGLAAGIDVNRSTVDVVEQEAALIAERAQLYEAQQDLLRLLHMEGEAVTLSDEPLAESPPLGVAPEALRPELARNDHEVAAAAAAIRLAQARGLPSVTLGASAGVGSNPLDSSSSAFDAANLAPGVDARAGVSLQWNPFDWFQTRDTVAQARLSRAQVVWAGEAEVASIELELQRAKSAASQLRARAPLMEAQESLARDNLSIISAMYTQGSVSILDLFDAQSRFRNARVQRANLRVALITAEYDLRWVTGEDLLAPGNAP